MMCFVGRQSRTAGFMFRLLRLSINITSEHTCIKVIYNTTVLKHYYGLLHLCSREDRNWEKSDGDAQMGCSLQLQKEKNRTGRNFTNTGTNFAPRNYYYVLS